jgi:uncharacterized protein (UPF0332 family)
MEFKIKKEGIDTSKYQREDIDIAYKFAKRVYEEFGDLAESVVLFGSNAKNLNAAEKKEPGDVDIMIIIDDVTVALSKEMAETYKIIIEKLCIEISQRLHVTSLKLTSFWGYVRSGDPVGMNILRDGIALLDAGFFDPLKAMLMRGMIRPSPESIYNYFSRAPKTLYNSQWHIAQAVIDLYWAVIDSAHSALMSMDIIHPSPENVADLLQEKLVKKKLLDGKYIKTVDVFYDLYKKLTQREMSHVTGREFDRLFKEATEFVEAMRGFINKQGLNFENV